MNIWHIWVIIALIFLIVEIFTTGFAVICFSIGALAAGIVAAFGGIIETQIVWFAIVSVISLIAVRPLLYKVFKKHFKDEKTNADAMIGRVVTVTETIDTDNNKGLVKVDGVEWSAVSSDGSIIEKGTKVKIIKINSIILTVKE